MEKAPYTIYGTFVAECTRKLKCKLSFPSSFIRRPLTLLMGCIPPRFGAAETRSSRQICSLSSEETQRSHECSDINNAGNNLRGSDVRFKGDIQSICDPISRDLDVKLACVVHFYNSKRSRSRGHSSRVAAISQARALSAGWTVSPYVRGTGALFSALRRPRDATTHKFY